MSPDVCSIEDRSCITCGDVAVVLVVESVEGADATCRDVDGRAEVVAIDLVDGVAVGDRLLVHARVALERLRDDADRGGAGQTSGVRP